MSDAITPSAEARIRALEETVRRMGYLLSAMHRDLPPKKFCDLGGEAKRDEANDYPTVYESKSCFFRF